MMSPKKAEEAEKQKASLQITNQFRVKRGMAYDLKCQGSKLHLAVSPRETAEDAGEWRVDAKSFSTSDAVVVTGWGATRAAALSEVGRVWLETSASHGLPTFDWDAVASALLSVRAI